MKVLVLHNAEPYDCGGVNSVLVDEATTEEDVNAWHWEWHRSRKLGDFASWLEANGYAQVDERSLVWEPDPIWKPAEKTPT